jgi:hypothetical protein
LVKFYQSYPKNPDSDFGIWQVPPIFWTRFSLIVQHNINHKMLKNCLLWNNNNGFFKSIGDFFPKQSLNFKQSIR